MSPSDFNKPPNKDTKKITTGKNAWIWSRTWHHKWFWRKWYIPAIQTTLTKPWTTQLTILKKLYIKHGRFLNVTVTIETVTHLITDQKKHCVKSVQIRSFFWYVFSCNRVEYKDLRRKNPYSVQMQESTHQKKTPYLDNFLAVKWCVYVWENSHVEERYNFHIRWLYFFAKHGGKYNK